jgi:hypothetical protein
VRVWRCEGGFIVERGPTQHAVVSVLREALPEGPFRDLLEYARVRADGGATEHYRVMTWSIEEELGVTAHAVVDGALQCHVVRQFWSPSMRVERQETVVVDGLVDASQDPDAIAVVTAALAS